VPRHGAWLGAQPRQLFRLAVFLCFCLVTFCILVFSHLRAIVFVNIMVRRFRKRYGRRGRKRMQRKRYVRKLGLVRAVKRVLYRQAETKRYTYTGTFTCLNDTLFQFNPLVSIAKGTGQSERIGERISVIGYKIVWSYTPVQQLSANLAGNTRVRWMIVKGSLYAPTYSVPTSVSASATNTILGTVRVGNEVFNTDTGKCLMNRTFIPRHQVIPDTSSVSAGITSYSNDIVLPANRYRLWFPSKGRAVVWQKETDNGLFKYHTPVFLIYLWNSALTAGATTGSISYNITVYYKDI